MHLAENLVLFVRTLRAQGVSMRRRHAGRGGALEHVDSGAGTTCATRCGRCWSAASMICRGSIAFRRFWRVWPCAGGSGLPQPIQPPRRGVTKVQWLASASVPPEAHGGDAQQDTPDTVRTYSAVEVWREKDFAAYSAAEIARARAVIARLAWTPGVRVTRRWVAGRGGAVDPRRLLRVNMRHGGEPLVIPRASGAARRGRSL